LPSQAPPSSSAPKLPDIDTSTSSIGQVCFPLSHWIEDRYPHRTIIHSLIVTAVLVAFTLPFGLFWGLWDTFALPLGHLLSCFADDTCTRQGVQLFYPYPAWCISVANPKRRLVTGAVVRFVGMGTGNKGLYIVGGVAMIAAMALKQLGQ
jgi:membrane-bound metal-dependent hydrolase YbcI (DUF457 family)